MASSTDFPSERSWEVADIFREFGERYRSEKPASLEQLKVMQAIAVCRTAYLGGHLEQCDTCGHERPAYNSCPERFRGIVRSARV